MTSARPQDSNAQLAAAIDRDAPDERIVAVLADALAADLVARDGTRQPDHRTRLDAAKVLLSYGVGTPIQRSEILTVSADADTEVGLENRLRHSPALRALFRRLLASAEEPAVDAVDV